MARFRKKPVEVEVWQNTPGTVIPDWVMDAVVGTDDAWVIVLYTPEGDMKAMANDYIIQGVKGEVYPCKPDIFEQTYEPVTTYAEELRKSPAGCGDFS